MHSSTEIKTVYRVTDLMYDLKEMRRAPSYRKGVSTGFPSLDELMTLDKGYLSIVTGYPSSGKSEFVDQLLVNCAMLHNWKSLVFSPENYPIAEHARKIIEKHAGDGIRQLDMQSLAASCNWTNNHFAWLYPPGEESVTLKDLLELAQTEFDSFPFDVLVIDPWNELSHSGQRNQRDDQYISACLTLLRRFIRKNNIHCFVVAHPVKPAEKKPDGSYPVPSLYDISGGATWRNKADYGWCAYRNPTENICQVFIQKIKFKQMGRLGKVAFDYDWKSGRFKEQDNPVFTLPGAPEEPPL